MLAELKSNVMIPHLRETAFAPQLFVHGNPFLILGGELQNSSLTSSRYMKNIWPKLKAANLNTVLGCVTWEQVEPVEGQFDFNDLDQIILDARRSGLHLILLWFGSFKNGLSTYTPGWIKQNPKRFPRAKLRTETSHLQTGDVLSIFGSESREADGKAFRALMQHLREFDEHYSTVIMVQVENEVGLLGDSRDRSSLAEERWQQPLPKNFVKMLQQEWHKMNTEFRRNNCWIQKLESNQATTWSDISGDPLLVDELFMAYHYALYVESVAAEGKEVYPIPLYTNVWQNYSSETKDENVPTVVAGGGKPGDYPSGGSVTNTLDIWRIFAPSLDMVCPDIYLNDYGQSCAAYRHCNQALFVPEQRRDEYGARRVWEAFGSHQCVGTAPFGIDTLNLEENVFRQHYGLLSQVSPYILAAHAGTHESIGFFFDELRDDGSDPSPSVECTFGSWKLNISRSFVFGKPSPGSGMVIHLTGAKFLLVGWGFQVQFTSTDKNASFTGILNFEEKEVSESGELRTLRRLNGDETRSGKFAIMPSHNPDYGGFPISVTIPAHTGIALCEPYAIFHD